ncbi:MAG: hypothetical protein LBD03_05045 [Methanobrevibacter sp.]|jgi:hypothetical protein|nr:hypothetical protein [Candidatus Methanovirga procula]
MVYRTKTYIAADWSDDNDAVNMLYKWKNNKYWSLDFVNAHDLTTARDNSLNCSIKASLKSRLDASKTFVLIVGKQTKNLRSGSCQYCDDNNSYQRSCNRGKSPDYRSYIQYECDIAYRDIFNNIVVLYNTIKVNKSLCPEVLKSIGTHVAMVYYDDGNYYWDYHAVKNTLSQ